MDMLAFDKIEAWGHPNIRATHKTTLEITREPELTVRGDCIVGVKANKAAVDLNPMLKELLRRDNSILVVVFDVNGLKDVVVAQGSSRLLLSDPKRVIIRKSSYIEPATIGIRSNKASADLNRLLIEKLKSEHTLLVVKLYALTIEYLEKHALNQR